MDMNNYDNDVAIIIVIVIMCLLGLVIYGGVYILIKKMSGKES